MKKVTSKSDTRRQFIKKISTGSVLAISSVGVYTTSCGKQSSEEKTTLLTPEGKLVQVPKSEIEKLENLPASPKESRQGIPNKKFVMVVDLAKCKNARKCIHACDKHHNLTPDRPYIKVLEMKDNENSAPYWMPKKQY